MYCFEPNYWCQVIFNLDPDQREYRGESMTHLLEEVLGKDNYDKCMIAQDPLAGGKTEGEIHVMDEGDFVSIGIIRIINH